MNSTDELKKICSQVRRDIVRMVHGCQSGHPGGSLGCTEFFSALYFAILNHDPKNFSMDGIGRICGRHARSSGCGCLFTGRGQAQYPRRFHEYLRLLEQRWANESTDRNPGGFEGLTRISASSFRGFFFNCAWVGRFPPRRHQSPQGG